MYRKLGRPNFRIHFTPDYSTDPKSGIRYPYYNKPHGLLHWLRHGDVKEPVVALVDPDMIFLRPITGTFENYLTAPDWNGEHWERVQKGRPAGQQYGLGDHWMTFNREYICGSGSPCVTTSQYDALKYFQVGPPYVLHVHDLRSIANVWVHLVPKIYEEFPHLLAEMYAYCMAAAHLGLRHFKVNHMMISNVFAGDEAWPWVDSFVGSTDFSAFLAGSLAIAKSTVSTSEEASPTKVFPGLMPTVLHLCQSYPLGEWFFGKGRVPTGGKVAWPPPVDSILSCSHPLLALPPASLANGLDTSQSRTFFMITSAIRGLNSALETFKKDSCGGSENLTRSFRLKP